MFQRLQTESALASKRNRLDLHTSEQAVKAKELHEEKMRAFLGEDWSR